MYSTTTDKPCEEICYEDSHIDKVMAEIKKNFDTISKAQVKDELLIDTEKEV